jgi:2'-5' RNA ligase
VRLFLALELDPPARLQLGAVLADLRRALGDTAAALRWTPPSNVHVTLHFLGEIDAPGLDRLRLALGVSLPQAGFIARTAAPGVLPHRGPSRVVYLGVGAAGPELAGAHDELARRVRQAGIPTEDRALSPHLTVARVRDRHAPGPTARALRAQVAAFSCAPIAWRVDHVTLFQSDLSGPSPRYTPLATMPLS